MLSVVFSFEIFWIAEHSADSSAIWSQIFKLTILLALDTSLICRSLVLEGVLKAVPKGVLKAVPNGVLKVPNGVPFGVRQLIKLAPLLALDTSLICRSPVLKKEC